MKRRLSLTRPVFNPNSEGRKNGTPCCSPDGDETILICRVFMIWSNSRAVCKKDFDLRNREAVLLTLRTVPIIPIEPADP
jgi:hypothetical protein